MRLLAKNYKLLIMELKLDNFLIRMFKKARMFYPYFKQIAVSTQYASSFASVVPHVRIVA